MARYRNETLKVMLTKEEKKELEEKAGMVGMSISKFVRIATSYDKIVNVDTNGLAQLAYEVNKIGTNINQIAKVANETGKVYENDLDLIREKWDYLNGFVEDIYRKINVFKGED